MSRLRQPLKRFITVAGPRSCNTTHACRSYTRTLPGSYTASQRRTYSISTDVPDETGTKTTTGPTNEVTSERATEPTTYSFEQINQLIDNADPNVILIDVREPSELVATGTIPTAVNIPISSAPELLFLPKQEFQTRMGYDKPTERQKLVFFCKAGVRSRSAAEFARAAGWKSVVEYPGSWLDWSRKGGKSERWQPGMGR